MSACAHCSAVRSAEVFLSATHWVSNVKSSSSTYPKGSKFTLPLVGVVKPIKPVCQLKAGLYRLEPKVPAIPVFMVVTKSAEAISALVLAVAV